MITPIRIGLHDPEEERKLVEAMRAASLRRFSGEPEPGPLPSIRPDFVNPLPNGLLQPIEPVRIAPDLIPVDPGFPTIHPGLVHYHPAAPYGYSHLIPGGRHSETLFGPYQSQANPMTGLVHVRASCSPFPPQSWTETAQAELGQIVTIPANQPAKIAYSLLADVTWKWNFHSLSPNYTPYVNLAATLACEIWLWNPSSSKVSLVNRVFGKALLYSPNLAQNGLDGSNNQSFVPQGQSNLVVWADIPTQPLESTYCVNMLFWIQANSGVGAVDAKLQLLQPA